MVAVVGRREAPDLEEPQAGVIGGLLEEVQLGGEEGRGVDAVAGKDLRELGGGEGGWWLRRGCFGDDVRGVGVVRRAVDDWLGVLRVMLLAKSLLLLLLLWVLLLGLLKGLGLCYDWRGYRGMIR